MKGKFGKVGLLCLAVLLGLGAMGVALAHWQQPVTIKTTVSTGKWSGCVAAGGDGGVFTNKHNKRTNQHLKVHALSLIDDDTIIFATDKKDAQFKGWGDTYWGAPFSQSDLWSLNMCTGTSQLYLDGDWIMDNPKYQIRSAHHYQEEGLDYLLMTIKSGKAKVGTPPVSFNSNDIFRLHIDRADPDYGKAELLYTIDSDGKKGKKGDDPEVKVVALCQRDDGIILFSTHGDATIDEAKFKEGTVIEFNPGADTYTELFYDEDILPGEQHHPEIHALATLPWPDQRLLLVFNQEVIGSDDKSIFSEDIAIWDIDTINLHISMRDF